MRWVLLLLVLAVPLRGEAETYPPHPLAPSDAAAVREVVASQLAAFQRDDGPGAFAFAAPGIKAMFGTPENFMTMVKTGYQPVYRPREVEFRDIVTFRGQPTQRVLLVGPDGVPVVAYYLMERQPDGSWLIAGCLLMGAGEATA